MQGRGREAVNLPCTVSLVVTKKLRGFRYLRPNPYLHYVKFEFSPQCICSVCSPSRQWQIPRMSRRLSGAVNQLELLNSVEVQLDVLARRVKENAVEQPEDKVTSWKKAVRKIAEDVALAHSHAKLSRQALEQYFEQQDMECEEESNINVKEIKHRIRSGMELEDVQSSSIVQKIAEIFDGSSRVDDDIEAMEVEPNENDFICPVTCTRMENPLKK